MKKKLLNLIISFIVIIGLVVYGNKTSIKGYEVNQCKSDIKISGTLVNGNQYNFHTFIQLGNEIPFTSSILELNLNTEIEFENKINKYILKNPKIEVNTIGCHVYTKDKQYINENQYSENYQFGVSPNETFKQTMAVGYAKLLLNDKNIKVNKVTSLESYTRINSISDLRAANDNVVKVAVDYTVLNQYYTQWYNVTFKTISDKEITICVR
ncbi:MAG: hypothetical protein H7Y18_10355 [Clostridiaceae bacterium]|nr:hypothetical protein [Clostridiaceae bacterium]